MYCEHSDGGARIYLATRVATLAIYPFTVCLQPNGIEVVRKFGPASTVHAPSCEFYRGAISSLWLYFKSNYVGLRARKAFANHRDDLLLEKARNYNVSIWSACRRINFTNKFQRTPSLCTNLLCARNFTLQTPLQPSPRLLVACFFTLPFLFSNRIFFYIFSYFWKKNRVSIESMIFRFQTKFFEKKKKIVHRRRACSSPSNFPKVVRKSSKPEICSLDHLLPSRRSLISRQCIQNYLPWTQWWQKPFANCSHSRGSISVPRAERVPTPQMYARVSFTRYHQPFSPGILFLPLAGGVEQLLG